MAAIKAILMYCIFCILLAAGILEANTIGQFSSISLRYSTPISGQTAHSALQYAAQNNNQNSFWPTFWHQCTNTLSTATRTAQASTISFLGDAMLVWHAQYLVGNAPSAIDGYGIAISEGLAHRLWGSINIIGMHVYVNGTTRIVRGVFEGNMELALLPFHLEDTSQSFTAVELAGGGANPTRGSAESFAVTSGLGRPDYILMSGPMSLARFMAIFPLFIPIAYALTLLLRFIKKHYPMAGTPVFFAGIILLAIVLPIMLDAVPVWLIPTHWSDFAFWSTLIELARSSLREFLSADSMLRDVELQIHLLRQTGIFILAVCSGIIVCAMPTPSIFQNANKKYS